MSGTFGPSAAGWSTCDLDWDPPGTFGTPAVARSFPPIPKPFRVDRGEFDSWMAKLKLNRLEVAIADREASLRLKPDQAEPRFRLALAYNNLAWCWRPGPHRTRDPEHALDAGPQGE